MNRYETSTILSNNKGKRRISSIIIPVISLSSNDIYIQTTSPERLDKLANTFYQDATLWWVIATSNGLGKGSLIIPENTRIRIPDKTIVRQVINEINKSR